MTQATETRPDTSNRAPVEACPRCGSKACMAAGGDVCRHTNEYRYPDQIDRDVIERARIKAEVRLEVRAEVRLEVLAEIEIAAEQERAKLGPGWPAGIIDENAPPAAEPETKAPDGPPADEAMKRAPRKKNTG